MADDKQSPQDKKAAEKAPSASEMKKIQEDYSKSTPKEKLKNFRVDPVTKTLRRA